MSIHVITALPEDLCHPQILLRELLKDDKLDTVWAVTKATEILTSLFMKINYPIVILNEDNYMDENYSDLYANYYVHSYRNNSKFSRRILIFKGNQFSINQWFNSSDVEIRDCLLAEIIIPNSSKRNIGIAFIRPELGLAGIHHAKIITGCNSVFILGRYIKINAFPYRQLDGGLLSCAEVSLLNILDYYHLNYGYRKVLPSDILKIKDELSRFGASNEHGMRNIDIRNVFQRENLQTTMYMKSELRKEYSCITPEMLLKRKIYSYIDSGFPCILLVSNSNDYQEIGHSIDGIGIVHAEAIDYDMVEVQSIKGVKENRYNIVNAADIDSDLIVMDDRCFLDIISISSEKKKQKYELQGCIIPTPERVMLKADDAFNIAQRLLSLLSDDEFEKYINGKTLILRTCLARSEDFIYQRINSACTIEEKQIYAQTDVPQYVWICEFSTQDNWKRKQVDCEIIIDATSTFVDVEMAIVSVRFSDNIIHNNELYNRDEEGNVIIPRVSIFSFKGYRIGKTVSAYTAPYTYEL